MHTPLLDRLSRLLLAVVAAAACSAQAQPAPRAAAAPTRGQLLYDTHCIECHNVQMHWRAASQATDWNSLLAQVQRWQATAKLDWSDDDIAEVTRHLNDTIYKFPQVRASR
ncbi:MAG TPA: cytochrome C [Ramlibacter sp.]|nr:cytochrome C [Ramlibacter sp.]